MSIGQMTVALSLLPPTSPPHPPSAVPPPVPPPSPSPSPSHFPLPVAAVCLMRRRRDAPDMPRHKCAHDIMICSGETRQPDHKKEAHYFSKPHIQCSSFLALLIVYFLALQVSFNLNFRKGFNKMFIK